MFDVPILLIIFNRPHTTARVFAEIKKMKPRQLFIVADGPRANRPEDQQHCAAARAVIDAGVDWDCEVAKKYFDINHGCGEAPFLGIEWFFNTVEEGIILEDDCVPDLSFFPYCKELLQKYRTEEKILMISGDNFQDGVVRGNGSYFFSRYTHTWGWASWRRAWKQYDFVMESYPKFLVQQKINNIWPGQKLVQHYWLVRFDEAYRKKNKDYWDVQWTYTAWNFGGLTCLPNVNLVSNIGFDSNATHTFSQQRSDASVALGSVVFPLSHPTLIEPDAGADAYTNKKIFKITFVRYSVVVFLRRIGLLEFFRNSYNRLITIFYSRT